MLPSRDVRHLPDEPFVPARGLASPHAQTIFAAIRRPSRRPPVIRERWETPDGDFLDVDWLPAPRAAPHLLVLHGLEGSSEAGYVAAMLRGARARGYGALALNFRSCSGEPNRLPRAYHSGETGDVAFVVDRLRARVTGPLLAAGFSLGGNVLLRLLAEQGRSSPLAAAAAVSVPFDLLACARALDAGTGVGALYRRRFLRTLKGKALGKARRHGVLDPGRIRAADGLEAYDDAVTAPLHGFSSAADYYRSCSSGPVLGAIRVPTLLLSSADDPLAPASTLPASAAEHPSLHVHVTERGGHVGFVAGSAVAPRFWGEEVALSFLASR